jgi:hypothetical protein
LERNPPYVVMPIDINLARRLYRTKLKDKV